MKTENNTQCVMIDIADDEILYRNDENRYCVVREGDWIKVNIDNLMNREAGNYGGDWFKVEYIACHKASITIHHLEGTNGQPDDVNYTSFMVGEDEILSSRDGYTHEKLKAFDRIDYELERWLAMSGGPIIKGIRFPCVGTYVNSESAKDGIRGYVDGQQDMLDSGYRDMSHYRRREITPKTLPEIGQLVVFGRRRMDGGGNIYVQVGVGERGSATEMRILNGGVVSMANLEWWAPVYIPEKEVE